MYLRTLQAQNTHEFLQHGSTLDFQRSDKLSYTPDSGSVEEGLRVYPQTRWGAYIFQILSEYVQHRGKIPFNGYAKQTAQPRSTESDDPDAYVKSSRKISYPYTCFEHRRPLEVEPNLYYNLDIVI